MLVGGIADHHGRAFLGGLQVGEGKTHQHHITKFTCISSDIEKTIIDEVRGSIERIIHQSILSLNNSGFNFEADRTQVGIWIDKQKNIELNIQTIVSVSCQEVAAHSVLLEDNEQIDIENSFYKMVEEGVDEKACMLASLEGDIANGGFEQLFLNKDCEFINSALNLLKAIGATEKHRLTEEAVQVHQKYSETLARYNEFQKKILRIEDAFHCSEENIPVLYHKKYNA